MCSAISGSLLSELSITAPRLVLQCLWPDARKTLVIQSISALFEHRERFIGFGFIPLETVLGNHTRVVSGKKKRDYGMPESPGGPGISLGSDSSRILSAFSLFFLTMIKLTVTVSKIIIGKNSSAIIR